MNTDLSTGAPVADLLTSHRGPAVRQNWVLDPLQDTLLIIAAPVLALAAAIATFKGLGGAAATSLIIALHIVFTVAHHLPTFIRIYGDVELFKRFKWSFVLAPAVPLAFSAAVLGYINHKGYPLEYFLYLYILLVLWDPWHFLRQHYGFMRIYDRHNAAPRRIASRMDLALCIAWFAYIMLASGAWLAGLLQDLAASVNLPLLAQLPSGTGPFLVALARDAAILATLAYGAYLLWCRLNGYFISVAKLLLIAATFGVMYLAYTPNSFILGVAPEWTFKAGFAVVGMVHVTQYLAIVWRYNRTLAKQSGRARGGWFHKLHARGGWLVIGGYVLVCVAYGSMVTTQQQNRWLMSVLLALGFTSTLLHYYFDGFIWKMRHQQNRENLLSHEGSGAAHSWWSSRGASPARKVLVRQLGYFGVPMALLSAGALAAWNAPAGTYIDYMNRAQVLAQQGDLARATSDALLAYDIMQRQLPMARQVVEIDPTAAHEAELAFLIYNQSYYQRLLLPAVRGESITHAERAAHGRVVTTAIELLEHALARNTSLAHRGRDAMTRDDGEQALASWRRIVPSPSLNRGTP